MRNPVKLLLPIFFAPFLHLFAYADSAIRSSRTDIIDNPFVIIAKNPSHKIITGYVAALRTSPGRTDECKFIFRGQLANNEMADLLIADASISGLTADSQGAFSNGTFMRRGEINTLAVNQAGIPGDCAWILGFIGEPTVIEKGSRFEILFNPEEVGTWLGVNVVRTKRAYFHDQPRAESKGKAFLVKGDIVYIYDERSDWFYVKYQRGKKETIGWIRKSDTVQFPSQQ